MATETARQSKGTILAIEDDPKQLRLYTKSLSAYRVITTTSCSEALKLIQEEVPDAIILDNQLANGERGVTFLPALKTDYAHVPIIIVSGTLDIKGQLDSLQGPFKAHYLIEKPVDVEVLRTTVATAIEECGLAETVRSIRSLERAGRLNSKDPERVFAARLGRQVALLKLLREGEPANVSQLSRQFKVSRRTIARDLQELVDRGQLLASVLE